MPRVRNYLPDCLQAWSRFGKYPFRRAVGHRLPQAQHLPDRIHADTGLAGDLAPRGSFDQNPESDPRPWLVVAGYEATSRATVLFQSTSATGSRYNVNRGSARLPHPFRWQQARAERWKGLPIAIRSPP